MEYNNSKSVTIPNQVLPLRELLHRYTNGIPISDNLERQGSYDFSKPFGPSNMPMDEHFYIGHDANEIDITIAQEKARMVHAKLNFSQKVENQQEKNLVSDSIDENNNKSE